MPNQVNLLLVEDDLAIREALTRVLVSENYSVITAASCSEAILAYDEAPVDIVLLDLNLGDEDGWEVFHALKELSPNLPIIVTSAQADRLAHSSATRAEGALEKPFDIATLLNLLRQGLRPKVGRAGLGKMLARAALVVLAICFPILARAQAVVSPTLKLTGLRIQNGNVIVSWEGGGATNQLQRATNISGPWQNLGQPTTRSSATNPMAGPIGFFRVMTTVAPPSVRLTSPGSGSTLSGTAAFVAVATNVTKVEFYCDSLTTPLGSATAAPYTATCDTSVMTNGSHTFYAKAYSAAGNSTNSAPVTVTVNNVVTTPGQLQWVKTMLSQGGNAPVNGIAADHAGNVVAVGYFNGSVNFGAGPISSVPVSTVGNVFILRYSSSGSLLWSKVLAGTGNDIGRAVAIDSQNNLIVVGNFQGTLDFGGGPMISTANENMFVAKYSPSGAYVWAKRLGGTFSDAANAVAVDGSDNVIVTGRFTSIAADYGNGWILSASGSQNIALVKLSGSTGSTVWAKSYGGTGYNQPQSLAVDRNGDVVITGFFFPATDLGGGTLNSAGANDIFLAKYSGADGSYKWGKRIGGASGDSGLGVATDPITGNIVLTGSFSGVVDFGGGGLDTLNNGGIYMSGYDPSGNYLWAIATGGNGDAGTAVSIDSSGNLALTGKASYAIYFGGSQSLLGNGQVNLFVAAFSLSGNAAPVYRWAETVGATSTGASVGNSIAWDPLGHLLVGGSFTATVDFGGISATAGAPGYSSGFLTQFSQ